MNLQSVAHRRLADAGRADGDDAVDHPFLALRRRVVAAVFSAGAAAPRLLLSSAALPGGKLPLPVVPQGFTAWLQ